MDSTQPLRIVQFLGQVRLEHGGVVRAVLDLCRVMAARGHQVTLATYDPKDVPPGWNTDAPGRPAVRLTPPPPLLPMGPLSIGAAPQIDELIARTDVLHLHGLWDLPSLSWAAAARRRGVAYVVSLHGMLDEWSMAQGALKKRIAHALLFRRYLNGAAAVHASAQAELEQAAKWFQRRRGVVLPLVLDLAPFEKLPGPRQAQDRFPATARAGPKVLFLSRLHVKKGPDLLIQAAALLKAGETPCTVIVAGAGDAGYELHLRRLVDQLGVGDCVHFVGEVLGELKWSLYQACDLFVLPTSQENFGLVLPEALACGTPVVTTPGVDIHREIAQAGGVIVPRDARAIAETLRALIADLPQLRRTGERGRRWVLETLATDRVAPGYEQLYRRAMD